MNLAWLLHGYQAILFWVVLPIAIFLLLWWIDQKETQMNLAWTFADLCQPTGNTRLGGIARDAQAQGGDAT